MPGTTNSAGSMMIAAKTPFPRLIANAPAAFAPKPELAPAPEIAVATEVDGPGVPSAFTGSAWTLTLGAVAVVRPPMSPVMAKAETLSASAVARPDPVTVFAANASDVALTCASARTVSGVGMWMSPPRMLAMLVERRR